MNILDKFSKKLDIEGNDIFYENDKIGHIQEPNIFNILNWTEFSDDDIRIELIHFLKKHSIRICLFIGIAFPNKYLISFYLNMALDNSNISKYLDSIVIYDILIDSLYYYGIPIEYIKENKTDFSEIYHILVVENRNKIIDSL